MWPKLNFASGKRKIQFGFPYCFFTKNPLPSLPFGQIFLNLAKTTHHGYKCSSPGYILIIEHAQF